MKERLLMARTNDPAPNAAPSAAIAPAPTTSEAQPATEPLLSRASAVGGVQGRQGTDVKTAQQAIARPATGTVLLTFKEAMDFLRVSRSTIYRLMWSGQLRGHKVGSTWRFYEQDLLNAVASPVYEAPSRRPGQPNEGQG